MLIKAEHDFINFKIPLVYNNTAWCYKIVSQQEIRKIYSYKNKKYLNARNY